MLEKYSFLAAFTAQILALSVLFPARLNRWARRNEHYPSLALYRALNRGIAVLGVLLLGWLFLYMRRADWSDGPVEALVSAYFMVQILPFALVAWTAARFNKAIKRSLQEEKRKAVLERRGLFDFVSPALVCLAGLSYVLFVAFLIYIERAPFPGFAGYLPNIGFVTLVYASMAFCVYVTLYGKKSNPLETHADRMRTIGLVVKVCVYSCVACVAFPALNFTLVLLDLQRWEPFALSVSLLTCAFFCFLVLNTLPRPPGADEYATPRP